jgi:ABC-type multidrug transport system permease subunit
MTTEKDYLSEYRHEYRREAIAGGVIGGFLAFLGMVMVAIASLVLMAVL